MVGVYNADMPHIRFRLSDLFLSTALIAGGLGLGRLAYGVEFGPVTFLMWLTASACVASGFCAPLHRKLDGALVGFVALPVASLVIFALGVAFILVWLLLLFVRQQFPI